MYISPGPLLPRARLRVVVTGADGGRFQRPPSPPPGSAVIGTWVVIAAVLGFCTLQLYYWLLAVCHPEEMEKRAAERYDLLVEKSNELLSQKAATRCDGEGDGDASSAGVGGRGEPMEEVDRRGGGRAGIEHAGAASAGTAKRGEPCDGDGSRAQLAGGGAVMQLPRGRDLALMGS